jgi:hypothetical protein
LSNDLYGAEMDVGMDEQMSGSERACTVVTHHAHEADPDQV